VEFDQAANGIIGFETALPLAYTALVKTGCLTMPQLVYKMSKKPAEILKLDKGELLPGKIADIVIFNPHESYTVDVDKMVSKAKNSPYHGWPVSGRVKVTLVNGKIVVRDGRPLY